MGFIYTLILIAVCWPWLLEARSAWRLRRQVRRECAFLDHEIEWL